MKRTHNKLLIFLVAAVSIAVIGVGIGRIIYVNIQTPEKTIAFVNAGQKDMVQPNIQMQVKSSQWYQFDDMVKHIKNTYDIDSSELEEGNKFILVNVKVKNIGKKVEHAIFCNIYLEGKDSNYDTNGMFLFGQINQKEMEIDMKPGQEMDLTLCYCLNEEVVVEDKEYSDFYLVAQRYPVKKYWRLR